MSEQKYTNKVIDAINQGMAFSKENSLSCFDVPSLLRALYDQEGSMYVNILKKLGIDVKTVNQLIDNAIHVAVKTTSTQEPEPSSDMNNVLYNAQKYQKSMGDDYMSVEHLLLAQFDCKHSLINKLKELDFYDNTSIFAFSDHGDYIGDYDIVETLQNCFEDSLTNVPLIIRPARQFSCVPRTSNAFVELTDISATIMDMCEGEMGCVTYGKSLMHVLAGDEEHADAVFCEGGRPDGDVYAMESGHDDPEDPYWPRLSVQQEEGPHERATMIRMGHLTYIMRMHGQDELYDLDLDPLETVNQIDDPSYGEPLLKMKLRMLEWYQQTADWIPSRKEIR